MSCQSLDMNSPYYKLFGSHPVLNSVKVFGTAVYPYLRPYAKNKLEPRTEQCVFLGYLLGYKGVVCYHRLSKRLFIFRHVVHDETVFPFHQQPIVHRGHDGLSSSQVHPIIVPCVLPSQSA